MNLLIIPGNSEQNKVEAVAMKTLLAPLFDSVHVHEYHHWSTGEPLIDFDMEFGRLRKLGEEQTFDVVLAKSVGITLGARAIHDALLSPKKCIFVGSSFPWAGTHGFQPDTWLTDFSLPTLFIQQRDDFIMPISELRSYIDQKRISNATVKEVSGENHAYEANEQLLEWIQDFLEK